MSVTTVGRHLIHYEALGRGRPLIFVHGWLGSWRYWWPSMQRMSLHYRTFALDLWGFGDSSKSSENYSLRAYVDMVEQFIHNMGVAQPVTLVGHGLGALVALRYARREPDKVLRLASVALPVHGMYVDHRLANGEAPSFLHRLLNRSDTHPEIRAEMAKTDANAVAAVSREIARCDFSTDIDSLDCQHLIVFGDEDAVVARPTGPHLRFQDSNEQRAFVLFEGSDHFPMLDETAKFTRLLLEFGQANGSLSQLSPKDYWQRRTY